MSVRLIKTVFLGFFGSYPRFVGLGDTHERARTPAMASPKLSRGRSRSRRGRRTSREVLPARARREDGGSGVRVRAAVPGRWRRRWRRRPRDCSPRAAASAADASTAGRTIPTFFRPKSAATPLAAELRNTAHRVALQYKERGLLEDHELEDLWHCVAGVVARRRDENGGDAEDDDSNSDDNRVSYEELLEVRDAFAARLDANAGASARAVAGVGGRRAASRTTSPRARLGASGGTRAAASTGARSWDSSCGISR